MWTSDRKEGAGIWTPHAGAAEGFRPVPASALLPGLTGADLAPLCASGDPLEQARHSRRLARRVAARILADLDRLFVAGGPSARARFSRTLARRVADRLRAAGPR